MSKDKRLEELLARQVKVVDLYRSCIDILAFNIDPFYKMKIPENGDLNKDLVYLHKEYIKNE